MEVLYCYRRNIALKTVSSRAPLVKLKEIFEEKNPGFFAQVFLQNSHWISP